MQALPDLNIDGEIDIVSSNHAQQRQSHGLFRYFGKLAPDVTSAVLDVAADILGNPERINLVDVMCGSGTTIIEANARGWLAMGIDVNPVAILYARVKITPLDHRDFLRQLESLILNPWEPSAVLISEVFANTRNAGRWFSEDSQRQIAKLRLLIRDLSDTPNGDAFLAILLGRLRAYSNASNRTGRIFFDPSSAISNVVADFHKEALLLLDRIPTTTTSSELIRADARATTIPDHTMDIVFCHPPYFGLYRFSADVLRFELEIGGWNRTQLSHMEIEEGWKSGDPQKLESYLTDMTQVMIEAKRIMRSGGILCIVISNSTLGDLQLPVVDRLAQCANGIGLVLSRHLIRKAHFGSATYHRSARADKVIQRDHVLFYQAD